MSDPLRIRRELRQLCPKELFGLLQQQKLRSCLLGGICAFLIQYEGHNFCVSELLHQGCQKEKARAKEDLPENDWEG